MQTAIFAIALPGVAGTGFLAFAVAPAIMRRKRNGVAKEEPLQIVFEESQCRTPSESPRDVKSETAPEPAFADVSKSEPPEVKLKRPRLFGIGGIAMIGGRKLARETATVERPAPVPPPKNAGVVSAIAAVDHIADTAQRLAVESPPPHHQDAARAGAHGAALAAEAGQTALVTPSESSPLKSLQLSAADTLEIVETPVAPSIERFVQSEAAALQERREQMESARLADEQRAAEQAEEQRVAEERERLERAAEAEAAARGEAWTKEWFIRLDPDLVEPDERERMVLVSGLGAVRDAVWVKKLLLVVLEQEQSERVRARAIGALARAGHVDDPAPFEAAAERSDIEQSAVAQAIASVAREREWATDLFKRLMAVS